MASIKNGNKESPPTLDSGVVKIVVIGEPSCGKTNFIRMFYDNNFPGGIYSHNGVRVYPCEYDLNNQTIRVAIFEIPSDPGFVLEQRMPHYLDAHILVFMHAFDNPLTFHRLVDKWIPEAIDIINFYQKPAALVGNKEDLRNDPLVLDRLAVENQSPVTDEEVFSLCGTFQNLVTVASCRSNNMEIVEGIFRTIIEYATFTE